MKTIRFGIIGAGLRGAGVTTSCLCKIPGCEIVAISDVYLDKAENLADSVEKLKGNKPKVYTDYLEMLGTEKFDAIYVSTSWEEHIKITIKVLEMNIPVAMEVGGAYSVDECWELVEAYERTKTPFMFMENCCYDKRETLAYNLAKDGKFGTIVYAHGAYRHDLRAEISYGDVKRHYRLRNYLSRNCDNYPTHELGPIAKILDINRGNRFVSLVSMSSKSCGLNEFANSREDLAHLRDKNFAQGDVVETFIKCENGELISLKLLTTTSTAYSREFTINGTKGFINEDLNCVYLGGNEIIHVGAEDFRKQYANSINDYKDYFSDYWKNITEEQIASGHGGMDYREWEVFVECLRENKPMPIDVYDAASWMCISCLTEQSIKNGNVPVEIPDFTKGAYKTREKSPKRV